MKRSNVLTTAEFVVNKVWREGVVTELQQTNLTTTKQKRPKRKLENMITTPSMKERCWTPSNTNLDESVWTAQTVMDMDELTLTDRSHDASRMERLRYISNSVLNAILEPTLLWKLKNTWNFTKRRTNAGRFKAQTPLTPSRRLPQHRQQP